MTFMTSLVLLSEGNAAAILFLWSICNASWGGFQIFFSQRSLPLQLNKMADKTDNEQSEGNLPAKSTPKDALVMGAILKEMGISDYEPRVINQMLEYTYREFINRGLGLIIYKQKITWTPILSQFPWSFMTFFRLRRSLSSFFKPSNG